MKAADTKASSAIIACTLLTVVFRSFEIDAMETFIIAVSMTRTNIAIEIRIASLLFIGTSGRFGSAPFVKVSSELKSLSPSLDVLPRSTEHQQEKVDKIEVERERTVDCDPPDRCIRRNSRSDHL